MPDQPSFRARLIEGTSVLAVAVMWAGLLAPQAAQAGPATARGHAPKPQHDPVVPGHLARPFHRRATPAIKPFRVPAPAWPAAMTATVTLPAPGSATAMPAWYWHDRRLGIAPPPEPARIQAGHSPVWLAAVPAASPAGHTAASHTAPSTATRVRVSVLGHAAARAAGVPGILMRLTRADGAKAPGRVGISVDYSSFRYAYGGDWADRLQLTELSGCASVTPVPTGCQLTPITFRNNVAEQRLVATVPVGPPLPASATAAPAPVSPRGSRRLDPWALSGAAGVPRGSSPWASTASRAVFIAAMSSPSGSAGSFAATSLSMSSTWSAGGNSGDFKWTYPLRTPPSVGGPAPALALSYDSAVVDGQMATSNNQPSWVGEGFSLTDAYIERSYPACSQDMGGNASNTVATGDLCWGNSNATLVLGGHSGELIADASTPGRWHLRTDDGTYISQKTGASNGSYNGEYWVVTTTDGTQYWFGRNIDGTNNSAWTVPVYGNNPGEPCHQSTFAASSCTQVWRWNLDRVVDPSGNAMDYYYTAETNMYAADDNSSNPVSYIRGGYLNKITYGTQAGSTGNPPVQVVFTRTDRCVTQSCGTHDGNNWPDTPWDMQCTAAPCDIGTPTFWNTDALASVQTQLYSGSGATYNPVTTWTLSYTMPDPGDGTNAGLWLSSIIQTGQDGSPSISLPPVTFTPVQLSNRVDTLGGALPPMNWMRLATINTESGGQIQVTYNPSTCVSGQTMPDPNNLQNNPLTCYPVSWTPPGYSSPITDFFNKYTVARVSAADLTTPGNPTTVTSYKYTGNPAWHYTDTTGIVPGNQRNWSVWRGYPTVETDVGVGADEQSTVTTYFRGMNGDYLPGGSTRSVTLPAIDMNNDGSTTGPQDAPAVADDDAFAGLVREMITYNGPGGPEVSAVVNNPYESSPTASTTVNGITVNARLTGIQDTHTRIDLDGGRAPLTTSTHTVFDSMGEPIQVQYNGNDAVTGDERCTLTSYARDMASDGSVWLVNYPYRVQKFATDCTTATGGGLSAAQVVSDTLTYYDGATTASTPPTKGLVTRTDVLKDWVNSAPVYLTTAQSSYDGLGRIISSTDVRGNTTTTSYTTNSGGQVVTTTATNALGWVSSKTVDPATGLPTQLVDPNGRVTTEAYDALGRLVSVWKPGRDSSSQSPSIKYSYLVPGNAASAVGTSLLTPSGGYLTTYQLYDGLLRPIQTQAPRGDGAAGSLLSDTFYDSAGMAYQANSPYLAAITPGTSHFVANEQNVPQRAVTTFDGAGRQVQQVVYNLNSQGVSVPFATTSWAYGGDRVDVTPPAGGVASSTYTDVWGNTVAVRQYHGSTPTPNTPGSYDVTSYTYNNKNQLAAVTDPAGNQWTTSYDVMGRVVSTTDPDSGTITTAYDNAGDVTSVTDSRGVTLSYTYDSLGRKSGVYNGAVNSADQLAAWFYDGLANSRGQLTKTISYDNANAYTTTVNGFTASYQPTSVTYTIPSPETGLAGSYTYVYTYAADGSPATTRVPAAGGLSQETLTEQYTAIGQPASLSTSIPSSTSLVPSVAYTGYGEPGVITLQTNGGNQAYEALTYDQSNRRLIEQALTKQTNPTTLADTHYTYDASGNILSADDTASGDNQCFSYDYADRLSSAWTPANGDCAAAKSVSALGGPAPYWNDWTFNAAGTRTGQVAHDTANGVGTTSYTVPAPGAAQPHAVTSASTTDAAGTHTSNYSYDADGNVTSRPSPNGPASQTLAYNAQGQLARVSDNGSTTTYTYDVNGNMLIERDPAGSTLYLPSQELRYTTATGAKAATRYYTMFGQTIAMRGSSGVTWMLADRQNTVNVTINNSTQAVAERWLDPYGNPRGGTSGTWPAADTRGYVNGTPSGDGLTMLGARQYDPALGRFTSVDPIRLTGQPQRYDPYAYSANNPVGLCDPTGLSPSGNLPPAGGWTWAYTAYGYPWDQDGYRYQQVDIVNYWCKNGIDGQCWGSIEGQYSDGNSFWLDQNGNRVSVFIDPWPIYRWINMYTYWTGGDSEYNVSFARQDNYQLNKTPLTSTPPVYGPTPVQPTPQPTNQPTNLPANQNNGAPPSSSDVSPICGSALGFLCTVGSAISSGFNSFVNAVGGGENAWKLAADVAVAGVCILVGYCILASMVATTIFGIIDLVQADSAPGADPTANAIQFAGNELYSLALDEVIPNDTLEGVLVGTIAGTPFAWSPVPSIPWSWSVITAGR